MVDIDRTHVGHEYLTKDSPVIKRPSDPRAIELLAQKLEDYIKWQKEMDKRIQKPDTRTAQRTYSMRIIVDLLKNGEVNPYLLRQEIAGEQGDKFDSINFGGACKTIDDFTKE